MTKHKAGESKSERWIRRRLERSKNYADYYHLDEDKLTKQHIGEMGEYFRSVTAKFSDKEMEDAYHLGLMIGDKQEPEQGITYDEAAMMLFNEYDEQKKKFKSYDIPDDYEEKVNRIIYVLQNISFEFGFCTTGVKGISLLPLVKTTKIKTKDLAYLPYDPTVEKHDEIEVPVIFNACSKKYMQEFHNNSKVSKELDKWLQTRPKKYELPSLNKDDKKEATQLYNMFKERTKNITN